TSHRRSPAALDRAHGVVIGTAPPDSGSRTASAQEVAPHRAFPWPRDPAAPPTRALQIGELGWPELASTNARLGCLHVEHDEDGVVRRLPLVEPATDASGHACFVPSFVLQMACVQLGVD